MPKAKKGRRDLQMLVERLVKKRKEIRRTIGIQNHLYNALGELATTLSEKSKKMGAFATIGDKEFSKLEQVTNLTIETADNFLKREKKQIAEKKKEEQTSAPVNKRDKRTPTQRMEIMFQGLQNKVINIKKNLSDYKSKVPKNVSENLNLLETNIQNSLKDIQRFPKKTAYHFKNLKAVNEAANIILPVAINLYVNLAAPPAVKTEPQQPVEVPKIKEIKALPKEESKEEEGTQLEDLADLNLETELDEIETISEIEEESEKLANVFGSISKMRHISDEELEIELERLMEEDAGEHNMVEEQTKQQQEEEKAVKAEEERKKQEEEKREERKKQEEEKRKKLAEEGKKEQELKKEQKIPTTGRDLFNLGIDAVKNGNFNDAAGHFQTAIDQYDHVESRRELAVLHLNKAIANSDPNKAFNLLLIAANANDFKAQQGLGQLYKEGIGTTKSLDKAKEWLTKAIANNDPTITNEDRKRAENFLQEIVKSQESIQPSSTEVSSTASSTQKLSDSPSINRSTSSAASSASVPKFQPSMENPSPQPSGTTNTSSGVSGDLTQQTNANKESAQDLLSNASEEELKELEQLEQQLQDIALPDKKDSEIKDKVNNITQSHEEQIPSAEKQANNSPPPLGSPGMDSPTGNLAIGSSTAINPETNQSHQSNVPPVPPDNVPPPGMNENDFYELLKKFNENQKNMQSQLDKMQKELKNVSFQLLPSGPDLLDKISNLNSKLKELTFEIERLELFGPRQKNLQQDLKKIRADTQQVIDSIKNIEVKLTELRKLSIPANSIVTNPLQPDEIQELTRRFAKKDTMERHFRLTDNFYAKSKKIQSSTNPFEAKTLMTNKSKVLWRDLNAYQSQLEEKASLNKGELEPYIIKIRDYFKNVPDFTKLDTDKRIALLKKFIKEDIELKQLQLSEKEKLDLAMLAISTMLLHEMLTDKAKLGPVNLKDSHEKPRFLQNNPIANSSKEEINAELNKILSLAPLTDKDGKTIHRTDVAHPIFSYMQGKDYSDGSTRIVSMHYDEKRNEKGELQNPAIKVSYATVFKSTRDLRIAEFHTNGNLLNIKNTLVGLRTIPDDRILNWAIRQVKEFQRENPSATVLDVVGNFEQFGKHANEYKKALLLYGAYLKKYEKGLGNYLEIKEPEVDAQGKHNKKMDFDDDQIDAFKNRLAANPGDANNNNEPIFDEESVASAKSLGSYTIQKLEAATSIPTLSKSNH